MCIQVSVMLCEPRFYGIIHLTYTGHFRRFGLLLRFVSLHSESGHGIYYEIRNHLTVRVCSSLPRRLPLHNCRAYRKLNRYGFALLLTSLLSNMNHLSTLADSQ